MNAPTYPPEVERASGSNMAEVANSVPGTMSDRMASTPSRMREPPKSVRAFKGARSRKKGPAANMSRANGST
ncbi:Uncharacterised protein [Collinsella intestinalis]|nr:Uncharacterised protein [Collinsella intestinalis]